jgi:hypothetical protein
MQWRARVPTWLVVVAAVAAVQLLLVTQCMGFIAILDSRETKCFGIDMKRRRTGFAFFALFTLAAPLLASWPVLA